MIKRFFARLAVSVAFLLIALLVAATAVAFFAYALFLALLNVATAAVAAALTGVILLLAAVLLALVARGVSSGRGRRDASPSVEVAETAAEFGNELGRRVQGFAHAHRKGSLLAALLAGFAFGASPKLRALLRDILKF